MPGPSLRKLADVSDASSLSSKMRDRRFQGFLGLVDRMPAKPVRVLDVGGTTKFWENRGYAGRADITVTTANTFSEERSHENLIPAVADATRLAESFEPGSFDIVFSNSTIEHLFTYDAQKKMADGIRALADVYYVQTPNFWFPIEPHFLAPAWHWTPKSIRVEILRRTKVGHRGKSPDADAAWTAIEEIRLLSARQLHGLFPDSEIVRERIGPLTKSLIAVRGQ
jgi:hypothetical protein